MLAAKTVLAIRYDAFGEDSSSAMGVENRAKLEARLRTLEDRGVRITSYILPKFYQSKLNKSWSFCHGAAETNPTRNHEVAGSIPVLTH